MLPTIDLGPFVIPTATLIYLLGIWLALLAVEKAAGRLELNVPWTYNVAAIAFVSGFVGARLVFVAVHWNAYRQSLVSIVWPLNSGFNLWAGLIIGACAAFFYGRARRLPPGATLDALAPGLLVAAIAMSLADFLAGPGYGTESSLPWSIQLFGISRHPVQVYEIVVSLAAIAVWGLYLQRRDFGGELFLLATIVFGSGRLVVDAFRANAILTPGGFHVVQIVALGCVLCSMLILMPKKAGSGYEDEAVSQYEDT